MPFLNYHHLMYFWTVAREGGVARAAEKLHLSSPTISAQIHELEDMLGDKLFERRGRSLVLTEVGQLVYKYADDIFTLGRELLDAVKLAPGGGTGPDARPIKLNVGISDAMPKSISAALLEPALAMEPACTVVAHEDKIDRLLVELATFRIDLILSDIPLGAGGGATAGGQQIRAYNHLLGEAGVTFFGAKSICGKYAKNFPQCLDGAPVFLPTRNTALRRSLDQYFDTHKIHPRILGEFEDSALLQTFGATGRALFPASSLVEEEVCRTNGVKALGTLDGTGGGAVGGSKSASTPSAPNANSNTPPSSKSASPPEKTSSAEPMLRRVQCRHATSRPQVHLAHRCRGRRPGLLPGPHTRATTRHPAHTHRPREEAT